MKYIVTAILMFLGIITFCFVSKRSSRDINLEKSLCTNMDEDKFWSLIEYSKEQTSSKQQQIEFLIEILKSSNMIEISKFESIRTYFENKSYTSDLWAIAYYLNEGCSDDSFDYYRGWLISEGREKYNNLTKDPELLESLYTRGELNPNGEEFEMGEKFISIGYYVIELKYPNDDTKQLELEEVNDKTFKGLYDNKRPNIEFNWKTANEIEVLFPIFSKTYGNN